VAGIALFALALAVVAVDGPALSGQMLSVIVLGAALGLVLDATWLAVAVDRLARLGRGEDDEGGAGWGKPGPDPVRPGPPSHDFDWWPEFERDFRAYQDARDTRERAPAAD